VQLLQIPRLWSFYLNIRAFSQRTVSEWKRRERDREKEKERERKREREKERERERERERESHGDSGARMSMRHITFRDMGNEK
jgi:hypothetical protein